MPFEGGGLPGVRGREGSAAQAAMEIDEEENLRGGEKDGGVGDVEVEGERVSEKLACGAQRTSGAGDAGELGVGAAGRRGRGGGGGGGGDGSAPGCGDGGEGGPGVGRHESQPRTQTCGET